MNKDTKAAWIKLPKPLHKALALLAAQYRTTMSAIGVAAISKEVDRLAMELKAQTGIEIKVENPSATKDESNS